MDDLLFLDDLNISNGQQYTCDGNISISNVLSAHQQRPASVMAVTVSAMAAIRGVLPYLSPPMRL
jgi:hypothetical protein